MSIISRLFGRRSKIPEILCDTEDGFVDLTFSIVGRPKHPNGTWKFHVRAQHAKQVVGFEVVLGEKWKPGTGQMALRLSKALGRSPESWLAMQHNYDLWVARQSVDLSQVTTVEFAA